MPSGKNEFSTESLPQRTKDQSTGSVYFTVDYEEDGKIKTTPVNNYGCWGCFYTADRAKGMLGFSHEKVRAVTYLLQESQQAAIESYPKGELEKYLLILKRAGVAQWFISAPKDASGYKEGIKISTEYPPQMVIGLLEMYRNALYSPKYVLAVNKLYEQYNLSPGAALAIPKVVNMHLARPAADAFTYLAGERCSQLYFSDLFSERHLLRCIKNSNKKSMNRDPNFTGVFLFFSSGYSQKAKEELRKQLIEKKEILMPSFSGEWSKVSPRTVQESTILGIAKLLDRRHEDTHVTSLKEAIGSICKK